MDIEPWLIVAFLQRFRYLVSVGVTSNNMCACKVYMDSYKSIPELVYYIRRVESGSIIIVGYSGRSSFYTCDNKFCDNK